jgi:hypothetical protein
MSHSSKYWFIFCLVLGILLYFVMKHLGF